MKRFMAFSTVIVMMAAFICGCKVFDDMGKNFHEEHATIETVDASIAKLIPAIKKAATKLGYDITQTTETPVGGEFEGQRINITYKKVSDSKTKVFVRIEFSGDKDQEKLFVDEIKKNLGWF